MDDSRQRTVHSGRARLPDASGVVDRAGVGIAYDVYGHGDVTILLMPTWQIVHSRFWKAQVGYLARHHRVVTFDGRGTGRSGRPVGAAAYSHAECTEDAVAVLDATGTECAVLVALSLGAGWAVEVAANHPDRVLGIVAISPACGFETARPGGQTHPWDAPLETTAGWGKSNRGYWLAGGYDDFVRFFFAQMFSEAHSTKQIEDAVGWAHEVEPATLVDATAGELGLDGAEGSDLEEVCLRVRCPVTVVHGTDDLVRPPAEGQRLAELTGGTLVLVEGGGHGILMRDPVFVNRAISAFARTLHPAPPPPRWTRAASRPRRVLYLSSPIGLGHARRDVAIVDELRRVHPDAQVDSLAQHPVTRLHEDRGERVHPASAWLASESGHIEEECGEHDLHAFQAIRRMDEILVNNFMVFHDVVEADDYDLVVGDEAWDVDYFLHENPELKRFAFAWMTDFVGWLPMPDGGAAEAALTADYNAEMIEQRSRYRRLRDRSVFVGNPDDVVDLPFGPGLPGIREWTEANFDFSGYVTGFDPVPDAESALLRERLGYAEDEKLCVVTVGGSGVGAPLLRRVLDAVPAARDLVPGLRFLLVTGPRIDPDSLPRPAGVDVRGFVPDLYRHLAAADLAVVQGGLTTCMELTANRTPFLYVPLRHHFEQTYHVRHRLDRYGAGRCLRYEEATDRDALAEAIAKELQAGVEYRPVETDGARRAAVLLADLL